VRLALLFPDRSVITRETTLACHSEAALYPEERELVRGCVEKRRREIVAARLSARSALGELGIHNFPLLAGPKREPLWPRMVVGSITHTDVGPDGYCGVAVADARQVAALGIDAEPRQALPAELWSSVLDTDEQRQCLRHSESGILARLIFSAKETTYKTLFPRLQRFLDFPDVHVDLQLEEGTFQAALVGAAENASQPLGRLLGRFVMDDGLLATGMILSPSDMSLAEERLSLHHVPC
jgi:4'-phosphopantetheinyl transferase EntD